MITTTARLLGAAVLAFAVAVLAPAGQALAQAKPMLIEGKQTLYQRVLTYPGATVHAQAGDTSGTPVPAMSSYYVYERKAVGGGEWLLVGPADDGTTAGWIDGSKTVAWKQQLGLAFTRTTQRGRTLMFRSQKDLEDVINAEDPASVADSLRAEIAKGATPGDFVVIAQEPETFIDIQRQFYLLPILDAKETMNAAGNDMRELHLASITGGVEAVTEPDAPAVPEFEDMLRNFSAAVVFVIDSTKSMGPYIERTKNVVTGIYDRIQKEDIGANVKFGLVAFRSKTKDKSELEYLSKVFVDPNDATGKSDFLASVTNLAPASASTARFSEDAFAGIVTALNDIDWSTFGGRYIVLITDAGALQGGDEYSSTGMDSQQMQLLVQERGTAIYTIHLLTPEGKGNHSEAESQYNVLSQNAQTSQPLLYSIEGGDVGQFGKVVATLSDAIVEQVRAANAADLQAGSVPPPPPDGAASADDAARIQSDVAAVGYAMQLAYLGRLAKTASPEFVDAWAADRDFGNPTVATMDVRVLLTKRQLSDLQQVLRTVLDVGKTNQLQPEGFFDAIRSTALTISRDPTKLKDPNALKLGDLGLLDEYLNDLPYKSKFSGIDQETWQSWSLFEQQAFLDEIERKLAMYQQFNDDADSWVTLAPGAPASEAVYPVPLDAMP
jgi:serine/threonine-protein kinase PpkA